jgi:isopentenyl-diphosphate delta-isomerase
MTGGAAGDESLLVRVDGADTELGTAGKATGHTLPGTLHRALAVVVVDGAGRLLAARRAPGKALWPGAIDLSIASHPAPGEGYAAAARRRLGQELGLGAEAVLGARFEYRATYGELGVEHEVCGALLTRVPSGAALHPHRGEIDEWRWLPRGELGAFLEGQGGEVCPWAPLTLLGVAAELGLSAEERRLVTAAAGRWLRGEPWRLL